MTEVKCPDPTMPRVLDPVPGPEGGLLFLWSQHLQAVGLGVSRLGWQHFRNGSERPPGLNGLR